ncbi:peptidoglycan-binding protein [Planktomarina temperata]|nr:peptidoglycan-binding protein [Planktomarina temperata]
MRKFILPILLLLSTQVVAETKFSVLKLQNDLTLLGFDPGPIDGFWGSRTKTAMCQFLDDASSACGNTISEDDLEKLNEAASKSTFKRTAKNGAVWDTQENLQILGIFKGHINGWAYSEFKDALKAYNKKFGDLKVESGAIKLTFNNTSRIEARARERKQSLQTWLAGVDINQQKSTAKQQAVKKLNAETAAYSVATKLKKRKTINVFKAWGEVRSDISRYGLFWHGGAAQRSQKTIVLNEVYWNYTYTRYPVPGIGPYVTKRNWKHAAEYGKTFANKIVDPNFQEFIVEHILSKIAKKQSDGVMLDWWHDHHQSSSGYSKGQVKAARVAIIKKLRDKFGPNKIILGNVNWRKDKATARYLNGVFLELYKEPWSSSVRRVYNTSELSEIEKLLEFYEANLSQPKLIALEGMRKTDNSYNQVGHSYKNDRNDPENRRMAKLLTAMSVVVPTNGYILYGDNNPDTPNGDHAHEIYDFYSFDIGQPAGARIKVSNGVSYKLHQKGFIAYNITSRAKEFTLKGSNGTVLVKPKSALFCKEISDAFDCLTAD